MYVKCNNYQYNVNQIPDLYFVKISLLSFEFIRYNAE